MRDAYKVHASYRKECGGICSWGHPAHLRAVFIVHIHSAFTWAQEQTVFGRSVLRLQGESLSTVFFLLFQDTQKVTDRWDSSDLQILKAVETFFLLKLTCPRQDLPFLCSHSPCNPIKWLWAIFPWNTVNFLEIQSIFLIKSAFL